MNYLVQCIYDGTKYTKDKYKVIIKSKKKLKKGELFTVGDIVFKVIKRKFFM